MSRVESVSQAILTAPSELPESPQIQFTIEKQKTNIKLILSRVVGVAGGLRVAGFSAVTALRYVERVGGCKTG